MEVKAKDFKVTKTKVYLNDKRSFRYKAIFEKDQGLSSIEEKLAKNKIFSFPYFKGIIWKKICYATFKCDAIKYLTMETGVPLNKKEEQILKEKIITVIKYKPENDIQEEDDYDYSRF